MLHVKDCLELEVEIRASDPDADMRGFTIPDTYPVIAAWPGLRARITNLLQNYEWEILDMLLYGET